MDMMEGLTEDKQISSIHSTTHHERGSTNEHIMITTPPGLQTPYRMSARPHGFALVIVNERSQVMLCEDNNDEPHIFEAIFEHLEYSVQSYSYEHCNQLLDFKNQLLSLPNIFDHDSFICYVSPIEEDKYTIYQFISDVQDCQALSGKPKIFFISTNCDSDHYSKIELKPDTIVISISQRLNSYQPGMPTSNSFMKTIRKVFIEKSMHADLTAMIYEVHVRSKDVEFFEINNSLKLKVYFHQQNESKLFLIDSVLKSDRLVRIRWSQIILTGQPLLPIINCCLLNEPHLLQDATPLRLPSPQIKPSCLVAPMDAPSKPWERVSYDFIAKISSNLSTIEDDDDEELSVTPHFIRIIDSRGHPNFLELFKILFRSNSTNIYVLQDDDVTSEITFTHDWCVNENESNLNYINKLRSLLSSNLPNLVEESRVSYKNPSLLLISDNPDGRDAEQIKQLSSKIKESFKNIHKVKLIRNHRGEIILPVNAVSETNASVRKFICRSYVEKDVPLSWFLFQQELENIQKSHDIISIDTCLDAGSLFKIKDDNFLKALEYFNNLTIIHYFPEILPKIVFLHPQPLLNKLHELLNSNDPELKKDGSFDITLLHDDISNLPIADFLKLMDRLSIIIHCSVLNKYFFLDILPMFNRSEAYDEDSSNPFILSWDKKLIPRNFYARLVVNLLSRNFSPTFTLSRKQQYCNATTLICPEYGGMITLCNAGFWLEISYSGSSNEYLIMKKAILREVNVAVKVAESKTLASKPFEGFFCVIHKTNQHVCCIAENMTTLTCCVDDANTLPISDKQRMWFNPISTQDENCFSSLETALAEGYVKIQWTNFILAGAPKTGKATVLDLLLDSSPSESRRAHSVRDLEVIDMVVNERDKTWSKMNVNLVRKSIKDHLSDGGNTPVISDDEDDDHTLDTLPFPSSRYNASPQQSPQQSRSRKFLDSTPIRKEDKFKRNSFTLQLTMKSESIDFDNDIDDVDMNTSLISLNSSFCSEFRGEDFIKQTDKCVYKCHLVKAIDSGGHNSFLDIAPILISYNSVNVLTHLMVEKLTDKKGFNYVIEDKIFAEPGNHKKTNLQYLEESFRSLATFDPYEPHGIHATSFQHKPNFILLGISFRESEKPEDLLERNQLLSSRLAHYIDLDIVLKHHPIGNEIIFPIVGENQFEMAKRLRKLISRYYIEAEIPARWFLFQLELKRFCKSKNKSIVSKKDCVQIGTNKIKMTESEVNDALAYLHDLTVFVHFSKILPDVIFLHPQPIIQKLSELVSISFPEVVTHLGDKVPTSAYENMKSKGVFTKNLLMTCFADGFSDIFTPNDFLKLMSELRIIFPLSKNDYFYPSALRMNTEVDVLRREFDEKQMEVAPLLFTWNMKPIPIHVLRSLVVKLLHRQNSPRFIFLEGSTVQQYCNAFQLMSFSGGALLLIDSVFWVEICYSGPSTECHSIQRAIQDELEDICKSLDYAPLKKSPVKCFHCSICDGTDHICHPNDNKTVVTCAKNGALWAPIKPNQRIWLLEQNYNIRPELNKLHLLLDSVSYQWREIAYCLDLPRDEIQDLMFTATSNSVKLRRVLQYWMDKETIPFTWKTILDVISGPMANKRLYQLMEDAFSSKNSPQLTDDQSCSSLSTPKSPLPSSDTNTVIISTVPTATVSITTDSTETLTDKDLRRCGRYLKEEDLKELAGYLDISEEFLQGLTDYSNPKVKAFQLLKRWKMNCTEEVTRRELIEIFEDLNLVKAAESLWQN